MRKSLPLLLLGINALILQVIAIRKLLTVFSGNELEIGVILAVWLLLTSIGSYSYRYLVGVNTVKYEFIALSLLIMPSFLLMDLGWKVLSLQLGELPSLESTLYFTILCLSAIAFLIGALFPACTKETGQDASMAYSLEALGAFIASVVFTYMLSGVIRSGNILLFLSIVDIVFVIYYSGRKGLVFLMLFPLVFYLFYEKNHPYRYKGMKVLMERESRFSELTLTSMKDQYNIYVSGKYHYSYPDPNTEEMVAHIPMSVMPDASDIMLIGGSPAVIRELKKYSPQRVCYLEIDPVLIKMSLHVLSDDDRRTLQDKRIRLIPQDALKYIRDTPKRGFDMVVLNLPEPSNANLNRYYTKEFFIAIKRLLRQGGMLYLTLPVSYAYISPSMRLLNGSIYTTLKDIFRNVSLSSEEYGIMMASDSTINTDPDVLIDNFVRAGVKTLYVKPYIFRDAFDPVKTEMVKKRLSSVTTVNTLTRPVAYFFNLLLWSEKSGSHWLRTILGLKKGTYIIIFLLFTAFISIVSLKGDRPFYLMVFSTGYWTMAYSMLMILAYQSIFGCIYERIGLLTGMFMVGASAGSFFAERIKRPSRWLLPFSLLGIILMGSTVFLLKWEPLFYLLISLSGILGGTIFGLTYRTLKEKTGQDFTGRLYATDLAGATVSALITTVLMVPLMGIKTTLLLLMLLSGISSLVLSRGYLVR